jgi:hypothetical protein
LNAAPPQTHRVQRKRLAFGRMGGLRREAAAPEVLNSSYFPQSDDDDLAQT